MGSEQQFDDVVQRLYEAMDTPDAMDGAFGLLADVLGLDGWMLLRLGDAVDVQQLGGPACDVSQPEAYAGCYEAVVPLARLAAGLPAGNMLVSQIPFGAAGEVRSGDDRHEVLAWRALPGGDAAPYLCCLLRGVQKGPFSLKECALAGRFSQHLERVLRQQAQLGGLALQSRVAESALDSTALAVFGLDEAGRVRYQNRRARGLTAAGRLLRHADDRLVLTDAAAQVWLLRVLTSHEEQAAQGPVTRLLRDAEGRCPEALTLLPLSGEDGGWLCLLAPLHARRLATVDQLGDTFSLTPAEARLARALAAGASLSGCADEARLQGTAVRHHLRSLIYKTGAERAAGVVRIVHALPAVRGRVS